MRIWKGAKLFAVVADGLNRAALHCLLAKSFLFGRLRLLIDIAVAAIVISREIRGRCLTAKVTVDALIIHEVSAGDILRIFVCQICHRYFLLRCRKLRSRLRIAIVFSAICRQAKRFRRSIEIRGMERGRTFAQIAITPLLRRKTLDFSMDPICRGGGEAWSFCLSSARSTMQSVGRRAVFFGAQSFPG